MEPEQALAGLVEVATQIRAAVLADAAGAVLASAGLDRERATGFAAEARRLLAAAEEASGGEGREQLVQIQAALPGGSIFVVRDDERLVAAVTLPQPTAGLVFYDLKTCLRHAAGEELAPKPQAKAKRKPPAGKEDDDGPR